MAETAGRGADSDADGNSDTDSISSSDSLAFSFPNNLAHRDADLPADTDANQHPGATPYNDTNCHPEAHRNHDPSLNRCSENR